MLSLQFYFPKLLIPHLFLKQYKVYEHESSIDNFTVMPNDFTSYFNNNKVDNSLTMKQT